MYSVNMHMERFSTVICNLNKTPLYTHKKCPNLREGQSTLARALMRAGEGTTTLRNCFQVLLVKYWGLEAQLVKRAPAFSTPT